MNNYQRIDFDFDESTLDNIASLICGDDKDNAPKYRSSSKITQFFEKAGLPQFVHDGSTRQKWVLECLKECNSEQLAGILKCLASPTEYNGNREKITSALKQLNEILYFECWQIKLEGKEPKFEKISIDSSETNGSIKTSYFLSTPDFDNLELEADVSNLLKNRWQESQLCMESGAYLSAIIMMGSMLEGLLLGIFQKNLKIVNQSPSAPTDSKTGKPKQIRNWKLDEMINVAHQLNWVGYDVKKFSHSLKEFRNLIHPYEQIKTSSKPDYDTCKISWSVVQATVNDLVKQLKNTNS